MIGGVEINPGPGSTTEEEICSIEIGECSQQDVIMFSQTVQHTSISSQVVPLALSIYLASVLMPQ